MRLVALALAFAALADAQSVLLASRRAGCIEAFDLETLEAVTRVQVVGPAQLATVTTGRLFTQRGAVGIEVFDPHNLNRLPTMKAPSIYRLRASPDGRLLFGIANWPKPSLDLFDAVQSVKIASRGLPGSPSLAGTWVGDRY